MTKQKGFTLIELLVVIAIIALLASVVLVALNGSRQKARDARRAADIKSIANAMELYFSKNNTYPASLAALVTDGDLASAPSAPAPQDGSCTVAQNTYTYTMVSASSYSVTYCLGAATGGFAAGVHTLTQSGIQ
ncbi:prepilin-type N-terminal cleavage/methylation domain-containing protein [Patescibacteria group bacterium]|nr:prepilin-type N-terminal cleavage/methylation domain-containing protein [Patescibacteria group bacterium]